MAGRAWLKANPGRGAKALRDALRAQGHSEVTLRLAKELTNANWRHPKSAWVRAQVPVTPVLQPRVPVQLLGEMCPSCDVMVGQMGWCKCW